MPKGTPEGSRRNTSSGGSSGARGYSGSASSGGAGSRTVRSVQQTVRTLKGSKSPAPTAPRMTKAQIEARENARATRAAGKAAVKSASSPADKAASRAAAKQANKTARILVDINKPNRATLKGSTYDNRAARATAARNERMNRYVTTVRPVSSPTSSSSKLKTVVYGTNSKSRLFPWL
jgi:hypothetical protein